MNATTTGRAPIWNKAIARQVASAAGETPAMAAAVPPAFPPEVLEQLGLGRLKALPEEPNLRIERLKADDARDAANDFDAFHRGLRRAVRIELAYAAKPHRASGLTWKEWVAANFSAGYECYQRYHRAAELQAGLITRGLPLLTYEAQARALAPFRRETRFWAVVTGEFGAGFPDGTIVRRRMLELLGIAEAKVTPRLRLHRVVARLVGIASGDDPVVEQALGHLRRALALLEKGTA